VFPQDRRCPFCAAGRVLKKGLFASAAGAAAFVSGIGCAYGMPDDRYVEREAGRPPAEASVGDGQARDATLRDAGDAATDASENDADASDAAEAPDQ
jgi:hypothetical protein